MYVIPSFLVPKRGMFLLTVLLVPPHGMQKRTTVVKHELVPGVPNLPLQQRQQAVPIDYPGGEDGSCQAAEELQPAARA